MRSLHLLIPLTLLAGVVASPAKPLSKQKAKQAATYIDSLVEKDLKQAKLKPNRLVDDATFMRRAYLGIIGRIPSEQEARKFLDDQAKDKRDELVDYLVDSPGFDSHLFNWAGDLLRVQTRQEQFGLGWHVWLRQSLAEDKPWDELVSETLGASGHCADEPAVGYYLRDRNMQLDNFSNTMQVFLGRQIGCAQCHDHPFDDWSQYEYYQMAAFGGGFKYQSKEVMDTVKRVSTELRKEERPAPMPKKVSFDAKTDKQALKKAAEANNKRKRAEQQQIKKVANQIKPVFRDFNKNALYDDPKKELSLPEDYQYKDAKPKDKVPAETLFGARLKDVAPENRRDDFAAWVSSPDNPYFTKVIANRMWARTFGHGLHEPIDDWKSDSEPAHPEVLAYLETTMKGVDYDLRQFLRVLYRTKLFQRECESEEPAMGVPHLVRGPTLQRMSAEQIYDSFIVLNQGEINDGQLETHASKWNAYRQQVSKLLDAEARDLMILAESTKQAEDRLRKAQSEVRRLQKQLSDTTNKAKRTKVQADYLAAREEVSAARKQREPLTMMAKANNRAGKNGKTLRASEHPAPFNPGTLMREFGGSDRNTPSSSDDAATVPQALALLNDYKTDIVGNRKSHLGKKLLSESSPEERLETLFITLYSRPPSASEIKRFAPLTEDPVALRDLARAMLTSNQFIFVQ